MGSVFRGTKAHPGQLIHNILPKDAFILRFIHHKMTIRSLYPRSRNSGLTSRGLMLDTHNTIAVNNAHTARYNSLTATTETSKPCIQYPCSNAPQTTTYLQVLARSLTPKVMHFGHQYCRHLDIHTINSPRPTFKSAKLIYLRLICGTNSVASGLASRAIFSTILNLPT